MDNHLFTEQEAKDIFSEDITVKRYKELKDKANERFCYIMTQIAKIVGREIVWFDFDNEGGNEDSPGYFDKDLYDEQITFVGEIKITRNKDFIHYDDSFPTKWLWNNFEKDLENEVQNFVEEEKKKKEEKLSEANEKKAAVDQLNVKLPRLKVTISEKIPTDVLSNINFKTAERMYYETTFDEKHKELEEIKDMINIQREMLRNTLTAEEFNAVDFKSPDKILHERQAAKSKGKPRIK